MKVLFFAPYIYDPRYPAFSRTSSGFGYMVNDILREVSQKQETYLLTHQFIEEYTDTYTACKHTKFDFLKGIRFGNLVSGLKLFFTPKVSFGNRLRYLFYCLDAGSLERCIRKVNPDIIHIHGLTYQTKPVLELCERKGYRYLVTLHGLNGLEASVNLPQAEKVYERQALRMLEEKNRPVTVVSSGVKKGVVSGYQLTGKNVRVILNGTYLNDEQVTERAREGYMLLCVGTVGQRKNQIQLIRACALLPEAVRRSLKVHIVGGMSEQIDIQGEIDRRGLHDVVTYHGFVPRQEMESFWLSADLNVVMSKSEGFGLSMIEGFSYGVPTVAFSDIDAMLDLYDPKAIQTIEVREDQAVADALVQALEKDWDHAYIRKMAQKYSMQLIADQYNAEYMRIWKGDQNVHQNA